MQTKTIIATSLKDNIQQASMHQLLLDPLCHLRCLVLLSPKIDEKKHSQISLPTRAQGRDATTFCSPTTQAPT